MNASKKALQDLTLSLRVYAQLELIGVRTLEQLRVLVAMRDKTRSQTVRTLLRARSRRDVLPHALDSVLSEAKPR